MREPSAEVNCFAPDFSQPYQHPGAQPTVLTTVLVLAAGSAWLTLEPALSWQTGARQLHWALKSYIDKERAAGHY
jgi:hypothetical protein